MTMTRKMKKRNTLALLPQSLGILQEIQRELQEKRRMNTNNSNTNTTIQDVVQGPHFTTIPLPIREYILQHDWKNRYKVQQGFSAGLRPSPPISFTLYIYTDQAKDPSADILATFAFLLDRVPKSTVLKSKYEMYFYDTPFQKKFPEKSGELIDEIHANSGFTVETDPAPIYIFRKEESRRVCIHEMLHALDFDGFHPQTGAPPAIGDECLDLLRPIQGQHLCDGNDGVRIYEALTETQATILNVLIQNPRSEASLKHLLNKERMHVRHQTQEIQRHYGIPDAGTNYTGYKQGVSKTISYFLFRGFLMDSLDRFIQKTLLLPYSEDYVEIIREGIQHMKHVSHGNSRRMRQKAANNGRKTLKMNFSA